MKMLLTEAEVVEFLERINAGQITLAPLQNPQDVYAGNVDYVASNGWKVTVFNDANEWDYFDEIESDDGRSVAWDQDWDEWERVRALEPTDVQAWRIYRIPGHMTMRCERCGAQISPVRDGTWICIPCGGPSPRDPFKGRSCRCGAFENLGRGGWREDGETIHRPERCGRE